jgi:hypothetical protein
VKRDIDGIEIMMCLSLYCASFEVVLACLRICGLVAWLHRAPAKHHADGLASKIRVNLLQETDPNNGLNTFIFESADVLK